MKAPLALMALALLVGCKRPHADQPNPGADGDARAQTAAKTLADLQAADQASQGTAPEIAPVRPHREEAAPKKPVVEDAPVVEESDGATPVNTAAPQ